MRIPASYSSVSRSWTTSTRPISALSSVVSRSVATQPPSPGRCAMGRWLTARSRSPTSMTSSVVALPDQEKLLGLWFESQIRDGPPVSVGPQPEQAPCFVIGQQQTTVGIDDQNAFPYRVQNGVVVLVHAGHLRRAEADVSDGAGAC